MVGVPRSRGCRLCVQRRVKCDETRPTCNNCKKGNRPCPGYGQDLKFQDEGAKLRKRFHKNDDQTANLDLYFGGSPPELTHSRSSTSPPESDDQNKYSLHESEAWDVVGIDVSKSQRRTFLGLLEGKRDQYMAIDDITPDTKVSIAFDPDALPDSFYLSDYVFADDSGSNLTIPDYLLSPDINQNQLFSVFKHSCFPTEQQHIMPAMRHHSRWLSHLPPLTGTNNLLDTAVRAVTLVHVGRLNHSEACVNESRPYYGKALRLLNTALMDKTKGTSSETLCATILLSFYEMFASNDNESWVRHAGGAGALMKMRGPERHKHGFDREIFLAYRFTLIIDAFQQDVACFLNEPEWLRVSEIIHDDVRTSASGRLEVFDVAEDYYKSMLPLPQLCSEARHAWNVIQEGNPPSRVYLTDLTQRLQTATSDFKAMFQGLESAVKQAGFVPSFNLSKDPVVSIDYTFPNIFISSTYTGYWTCVCVMNMCLQGVESHNSERIQEYKNENREHALNVCRSTSYMLRSSFLGPFFIIFGLRIALIVFEDSDGPELDWVLEKLFEIGDHHMGIAKHIPGFTTNTTLEEMKVEYKKNRSFRRQETQNYDSGWMSDVSEATRQEGVCT